MAAVYDRIMARTEASCLQQWRAELLGGLTGEVAELGAGTGANIEHYGEAVTRLVLTEPDVHMRRHLQRRAALSALHVAVVDAGAEALPFSDESLDAVVATLVFCSVHDPAVALSEAHRVLRPGGRLVFIEHVAAPAGTGRRTWQRRAEPIWKHVAGNCRLTRDTAASIGAAGFEMEHLDEASIRGAMPLIRPSIRGTALRQ